MNNVRRYEKSDEGKRRLTEVERYINKVKEGCGSRSFKDWLSSRPMDAFVVNLKKLI